MNALIRKEFRLLSPAWVAALLASLLPLLLRPESPSGFEGPALYLFAAGLIPLGLSSFGREFNLNTFPLLLAQPLERRTVWRVKTALLAITMGTVFVAWMGVCYFQAMRAVRLDIWTELLTGGAVAAGVAFSGGLWTTLLLRQVTAAFWFTILIPGAILTGVAVTEASTWTAVAALLLYSAAGFILAQRLFMHAQEPGWTGGHVDLRGWRSLARQRRSEIRAPAQLRAFVRKELQLHKVAIYGMVSLFLIHLVVLWVRRVAGADPQSDSLRATLQVFGGVWTLVPLLVGALSVAEERKLGTLQSQLCLPLASQQQFLLKLALVLMLGAVTPSLLLWTSESIGHLIGAGPDFSGMQSPFQLGQLGWMCLLFCILALAGFYGSTLSPNVVQAIAVGLVTAILVGVLISLTEGGWQSWLVKLIGIPVLLGTGYGLALGNFRAVTESVRWNRNVWTWLVAFGAILTTTALIYYRTWELVIPLEPHPGPPRVAAAPRPALHAGSKISTITGGGEVHLMSLMPRSSWKIHFIEHPFTGSNWVKIISGYRESIGLRSDGTLWLASSDPKSEITRIQGTNWLQLVQEQIWSGNDLWSVILLKTDGTLWQWGTNSYSPRQGWPGLRSFQPHQVGTHSNWSELQPGLGRTYVWNQQQECWALRTPNKSERTMAYGLRESGETNPELTASPESTRSLERVPGFDGVRWRSFVEVLKYQNVYGQFRYSIGVRRDGSLWGGRVHDQEANQQIELVQIGSDTDWVEVTGNYWHLAGLKSDGTLWSLGLENRFTDRKLQNLAELPVSQLSSRSDWLTIASWNGGILSLGMDGTLWFWRPPGVPYDNDRNRLLAPSRRPSLLATLPED